MGNATEWFDNELFWKDLLDTFFDQQKWNDAAEEVDHVLERVNIEPKARILDLCCGPGRHALELARRGYRVTGVDRTRMFLDKAQQAADAERLKLELVHEDNRRFCRPDSYHAIINMFTSFGYYEDPEDDRKVLRNIYRSLQLGGVFLIEHIGKENIVRNFQKRDWYEFENGNLVLDEREVADDWSGIRSRWVVFSGEQRREYHLFVRLYSAVELKALLQDCGFGDVEIYGGLDGAPYDQSAKRQVAVARKTLRPNLKNRSDAMIAYI